MKLPLSQHQIEVFIALPSKPTIYALLPPPALTSQFSIDGSVIENEIIPIIQEVASETDAQVINIYMTFNENNPRTLFGEENVNNIGDGIHPNEKGLKLIAQTIADEFLGY